jgi:uncharacterized membrane protein YqaE (UPF0057 family)
MASRPAATPVEKGEEIMDFGVFILLVLLAALAYGIYQGLTGSGGVKRFCANCGHEGPIRMRTKGSILIEILLWLMLLVPGLIYSIWRHTTRAAVCERCESEQLMPIDSPMARKLRAELAAPPAPTRTA